MRSPLVVSLRIALEIIGMTPLLNNSQSFIIYLKEGATVVNRMFTNIKFAIHGKINSRLFVMVSHISLLKAKERALVRTPSCVDNSLIVK